MDYNYKLTTDISDNIALKIYYIQLSGYTFSANNLMTKSVSESSLIRLNVPSLDQNRLPQKIARRRISTSLKVFLFFLFVSEKDPFNEY